MPPKASPRRVRPVIASLRLSNCARSFEFSPLRTSLSLAWSRRKPLPTTTRLATQSSRSAR
ncbi:MAG: hypothetical protein ACK56F_06490, partial [bacterium]